MSALDAFLYGMPVVLMIGAGVTLWFAKRAAREIDSHKPVKRPILFAIPPSPDTASRADAAEHSRVGVA